MKTIKIARLFFVILLVQSCAVRQQETAYYQDQSVDFQLFYDQLSPYGQWVNYTNYGYVWVPDVRREFIPYSTNGHWVMTDYGWTWASNYRWGWAPFHYGRWDYDNYYGWFWVPDDQWGPAWVTWRGGNGYYGWAPMRPGVSISNSFTQQRRDLSRWNFVRDTDLGKRDLHRYYINRGNYNSIIDNTSVINNTRNDNRRNATYVAGPTEESVQRATGRAINRVRIQDNNRPGEKLANDELRIYRPTVRRSSERNAAPAKVATKEEVRPVGERGTANSRNMKPFNNNREVQQDRQVERRRTDRSPGQQQTEKSRQISQTQQADPQQPTSERRDVDRPRQRPSVRQKQLDQAPRVTPPPSTKAGSIEQQRVAEQDRTRQEQLRRQQELQVQRQQQQLERKQQQLERQQELQRRRQERQQIRQQQSEISEQIPQVQPGEQTPQERNTTSPSGSRRR